MLTVLQTDRAWSDYNIERDVIEAAGYRYITGPAVPAPVEDIDALVRAHDPAAIMTCWAQVSATAIASANDLRIVQRIGVGLDNIAVDAATECGSWVANIPDYCVGEVSDHAIALLLDWARGVSAFDTEVKAGIWDPSSAKLRRVSDLVVGIIGLGRTGTETAKRLSAFGCRILAHTRTPKPCEWATQVSLTDLLGACDVLILHAPLTPETHHMIDVDALALMRPGAFLINVSRGPLVDTQALIAALDSGQLAGAGLDVVEGEPEPPRLLVERANVRVTPHVAFSSGASIAELRRRAAENVVAVLQGKAPTHPCNHPTRV